MAEQSYTPMIGVDKLYYALVSSDTTTAYTAGVPVEIPGLTEAGYNLNPQISTFYADNGPYDTASALGDTDVSIACADVPPELKAILHGFTYDDATGEMSTTDINSPSIAIMFRMQKSNGAFRYVTFYKAKAVPNEEKAQTKGGSINFQTNGFTLKAAKRLSDGRILRMLDSDDPNLPEGVTPALIEQKWFTDVDWAIATGA